MLCVRRARSALFTSCLLCLPFVACSGGAFSGQMSDTGGAGAGTGGRPTGGSASAGSMSAGKSGAGGHSGSTTPAAAGAPADISEGGAGGAAAAEAGAPGMTEGEAGAGGGGEPPLPISTNGLVLWFRADAGVKATNGSITGWADQSGNHHDAMQSVESLYPRLVKSASAPLPVVQLDGTDDFLELPVFTPPLSNGLSFFAVAARSQESHCSALLELSNGREMDDISFDSTDDTFQFEVVESTVSATAGVFPQGKLELLEALQTSDPMQPVAELRANGAAVGGGPVQAPQDLRRMSNFIGKSLYESCPTFPGAIAEIILYGRRLDVDERLVVEGYLKKKWQCCG